MKRICFVLFVVLFASIAVSAHCTTAFAQSKQTADRKTVVVFAAASMNNALDEIKKEFIKRTGIEVQTSYAASAPLAKQITNGADADIFISADVKWADYLAEKQFVAQRRDVIGNRLVIVANKEFKQKIEKPEDLLLTTVEHVAIGEPNSVPAGKYAGQSLKKLELWDKLQDKIVPAQDVRQALMFVETGAAEAGIVYATDAAISKKVRIQFEFPEKLTGPIVYPIVLLNEGKRKSEAEMFFVYLDSPDAIKIFKKDGFVIQAK